VVKTGMGLLLSFAIGILCNKAGIPLPAPPVLIGGLLVLAMTLGYVTADRFIESRINMHRDLCGGPSGETGG
jgi:XapX domain-containing protein